MEGWEGDGEGPGEDGKEPDETRTEWGLGQYLIKCVSTELYNEEIKLFLSYVLTRHKLDPYSSRYYLKIPRILVLSSTLCANLCLLVEVGGSSLVTRG